MLSIINCRRSVAYATERASMAQNKPQTEDLRVRRTRKLLMEAMIALTIEQGFAAITVQELVDRAMINRATFYRHYLDKYDLLEKYMDEVYALTAAQEAFAGGQTPDASSENPPVGMVSMLEHVQRHAAFYRVMLGKQGDPAFVQRIQQYSEKRLRSLLPSPETQTKPNDPPLDLCLRYLSHAGIGVISWWLSESQSSSPEQVALWLNQLNKATLDLVMGDAGAA
jgi:AcrR family transcriptional regulator